MTSNVAIRTEVFHVPGSVGMMGARAVIVGHAYAVSYDSTVCRSERDVRNLRRAAARQLERAYPGLVRDVRAGIA